MVDDDDANLLTAGEDRGDYESGVDAPKDMTGEIESLEDGPMIVLDDDEVEDDSVDSVTSAFMDAIGGSLNSDAFDRHTVGATHGSFRARRRRVSVDGQNQRETHESTRKAATSPVSMFLFFFLRLFG